MNAENGRYFLAKKVCHMTHFLIKLCHMTHFFLEAASGAGFKKVKNSEKCVISHTFFQTAKKIGFCQSFSYQIVSHQLR